MWVGFRTSSETQGSWSHGEIALLSGARCGRSPKIQTDAPSSVRAAGLAAELQFDGRKQTKRLLDMMFAARQ